MEFKFGVNEYFKEPIVEVTQNLLPPGFRGDKRALWDTVSKVSEVVNSMGLASAAAQGLTKPITTADRLRNSEHRLYLLIDSQAANGGGAITGMLKTGKKGLYVFDREGQHHQVQPNCILDFYVHESRQRQGLGRKLFDHMLQKEKVEPVQMAIDRPSEKFLAFLNKHYNLANGVRQMNNYVVFDGFFPKSPAATPNNNNSATASDAYRSPKQPANGLQQTPAGVPMGRYGARRPPCSMGQIIHNETSVVKSTPEPSGYYAKQPGLRGGHDRVTLFGEHVSSNNFYENEDYDYNNERTVDKTAFETNGKVLAMAASRSNLSQVLPAAPISQPPISHARSDLTIIAPPAQFHRNAHNQEQSNQNNASQSHSGNYVPLQPSQPLPYSNQYEPQYYENKTYLQEPAVAEITTAETAYSNDTEQQYNNMHEQIYQTQEPQPQCIPESETHQRYINAEQIYRPQTMENTREQEIIATPLQEIAPNCASEQTTQSNKQINPFTLPSQRFAPEQLCAKCGQNPIIQQDYSKYPVQHPEGQYCSTYNTDYRPETLSKQSQSNVPLQHQSGDNTFANNPAPRESSFTNVMQQKSPQYYNDQKQPQQINNNISHPQASHAKASSPSHSRGPASKQASQHASPSQSRANMTSSKVAVQNPSRPALPVDQQQSQHFQEAGGVTPREERVSPRSGDTQPEEQITSSTTESVKPTPKLERPRSLSIQLSEDTDKNCAEEKNSNERISECSAEQLDNIENDVENLAINETNDNVDLNDCVSVTGDEHGDANASGDKKPDNLTDQGYVDLKFYHSKLW